MMGAWFCIPLPVDVGNVDDSLPVAVAAADAEAADAEAASADAADAELGAAFALPVDVGNVDDNLPVAIAAEAADAELGAVCAKRREVGGRHLANADGRYGDMRGDGCSWPTAGEQQHWACTTWAEMPVRSV